MRSIEDYYSQLTEAIEHAVPKKEPRNLYVPIGYILKLGGKRIRPVLTLLSADIFGADYRKALPAALAVEIFHNFSLIHDDIMDDAPLRRGQTTVHEKWNINTGILSGDAMLILAYRYFEAYEPETFRDLAKLFSKTALEVCEGQQWDIDFEVRDDVTVSEYLRMIEYKTAVLVGAAMKMGAIVARTSQQNADLIYDFGRDLGIAFQLQDDYLDAFGDPSMFGKQTGGDIIENKKTFLYLKAMEFGSADDISALGHFFDEKSGDNRVKIESVKKLYQTTGAAGATISAIGDYTRRAFDTLEKLDVDEQKKQVLRKFGNDLMTRNV